MLSGAEQVAGSGLADLGRVDRVAHQLRQTVRLEGQPDVGQKHAPVVGRQRELGSRFVQVTVQPPKRPLPHRDHPILFPFALAPLTLQPLSKRYRTHFPGTLQKHRGGESATHGLAKSL